MIYISEKYRKDMRNLLKRRLKLDNNITIS